MVKVEQIVCDRGEGARAPTTSEADAVFVLVQNDLDRTPTIAKYEAYARAHPPPPAETARMNAGMQSLTHYMTSVCKIPQS